nr:MAG TPA: hypothetical protein [Crassvirales sp.]
MLLFFNLLKSTFCLPNYSVVLLFLIFLLPAAPIPVIRPIP